MAISGSVESVALDGQSYSVAADADVTVTIGGFKNETKINGNGTGRTIKERVPWKLAGLQLAIDFDAGDPAVLQNLADGEPHDVVITFADDSKLNGTGVIEGDLGFSSQDGTASMDLSGAGTLTQ